MTAKKKAAYPKIRIKLVLGTAGTTKYQRAVVRGLGLRKRESSVIREMRPEIMGMVRKVGFMLKVEEVSND